MFATMPEVLASIGNGEFMLFGIAKKAFPMARHSAMLYLLMIEDRSGIIRAHSIFIRLWPFYVSIESLLTVEFRIELILISCRQSWSWSTDDRGIRIYL